ncbi:MAG: (2Fe-2S)-binding protein [Candidatus Undinarchaeales archaeon]|jgi:carbon-monoxide dehydrogenase small subunit|nr:(2Fe-2S)-binding protein [Candidatus Undinarchaeales archaeon]MDP7494103.1 (2Fe-2S)-binding protein [Candidatus Undinarchaeales archaeon]
MVQELTITVNGEERMVPVEPNETLLEVLRDRLGITSPKCGCDRGDCGACTVLLDGRSVRSCLVLAVEAAGHEVTTLEGLNRDGLTPLQQAFLDRNAFQCGFCAPGIILTVTDLLERNPNPSREDVQEALTGNLCRCTGYAPIIDAVLETIGGER